MRTKGITVSTSFHANCRQIGISSDDEVVEVVRFLHNLPNLGIRRAALFEGLADDGAGLFSVPLRSFAGASFQAWYFYYPAESFIAIIGVAYHHPVQDDELEALIKEGRDLKMLLYVE